MKAKVRYLCLVSDDPSALADFYCRYVGMRVLGSADEGIALTDGYVNLSIVKPDDGDESPFGLSHLGIDVDDLDEVEARVKDILPGAEVMSESGGVTRGEFRVLDPNGIPVSLSTKEFNVARSNRNWPHIRHIAMMVPNTDGVLEFFVEVFGFRELTSSFDCRRRTDAGRYARMVGDGDTNIAILPDPETCRREGPPENDLRWGLNHFGVLAQSIDGLGLPDTALEDQRPDDRPFAEYRAVDPQGNGFDVSSDKGYEVDYGVYLTARDGHLTTVRVSGSP